MKVPKTIREARRFAIREVARLSGYSPEQHQRAAAEQRVLATRLEQQAARAKTKAAARELRREASLRRQVAVVHEAVAERPARAQAVKDLRQATREVKAATRAARAARREVEAAARPTRVSAAARKAHGTLGAKHALEAARLPEYAARDMRVVMAGTRSEVARGIGKWMAKQDPTTPMTRPKLTALLRELGARAKTRLDPDYPFEQHVRNGMVELLDRYVERTSSTAATHAFEEARFFDRVLGGPAIRLPTVRAVEANVSEGLAERLDVAVGRTVERVAKDFRNRLALGIEEEEPIESMVSRLAGSAARSLLDDEELVEAGEALGEALVDMAESDIERTVKTEVMNAYNEGKKEALDEIEEENADEYVTLKRWDATLDKATCERCEALHHTTIELDEEFVTEDGDTVDQPPLHPYCRCDLVVWMEARGKEDEDAAGSEAAG